MATGTFLLSGGGNLYGGSQLSVPLVELLVGPLPLFRGVAPAPPPAALAVFVVDNVIEVAPDTLTVYVANGTPDGDAQFDITIPGLSTTAAVGTFDDSGTIAALSVPVVVGAEGTYSLVVTDLTTSLTGSVSFTVAALQPTSTIGGQVTTPPTNVQPSTGVRKWVFQDPVSGDVYHFAINPNKMNSPFAPKRITFTATTAIDGQSLAFEGQPTPLEWQFSGTLFDKAQYDAFVYWALKRNRIWITDHWNRAWLCYLTHFDPQPRRAANVPWCHEWTMTALIFEGPVVPS